MKIKWSAGAAFLVAALFFGCSSRPQSAESKHVAAAKEALRREWNWKRMEVDDVRWVDGHWVISVWHLPKTPGGMATVEVSQNGDVLRMIPGM